MIRKIAHEILIDKKLGISEIRYRKNTKKMFWAKYFQQIKNGHFKMSIFYFPIYFCVKKK